MTLVQLFTAIANAIRAKKGTSGTITASNFPTEIAGIQTGKLTNEEYTKANNNLDDILYQSQNVLPDTYQQVEYLESTGTQYIDTGYAFTEPDLKFETKYRKTSTLKCNVCGVDFYPTNPRKIHGNVYNNALYLGNSSVVSNVTQVLNVDYIVEFEFKNNVAKWLVNGTEYTYNGANGWEGALDGETDYLFATRGLSGPGYLFTGRIYYVKFYNNNGDLVRNFVPCYRKSDDKPGMYDTVNNVFYTNEGDGEFIVGEDVDVLNSKIESVLTEKNAKIIPENIKKDIKVLGITGTYEGESSGDYNAKFKPLTSSDRQVQKLLTELKPLDISNVTDISYVFYFCSSLLSVPEMDTSGITNATYFCHSCSSLVNVPVYDFSSLTGTNNSNLFANCPLLSNDSLNNILATCLTMTGVTNKTLKYIGLSSTQATTCRGLSNWSSLSSAGWTTGY